MYPTKSTYDYMTEMNRLFPRTTENDAYQTQNTMTNASFHSPLQQTFQTSSSSADSMSPESFPDMSRRSDTERQAFETPFIVRRQRPIVGRKIFENTDRLPPTLEPTKQFEHDEFHNSIWPTEDQLLFPPTPPKILVEQKNYTQNFFYELFPKENKGFEFKMPVSPVPTSSPVSSYSYAATSPKFSPSSNRSPVSASLGYPRLPTSPYRFNNQQNFVPTSSRYPDNSLRPTQYPDNNLRRAQYSDNNLRPVKYPDNSLRPAKYPDNSLRPAKYPDNSLRPAKYPDNSLRPAKMCTFCRKNGETPLVYMTHSVKERVGDQYIVSCPILRAHVCATCGASGDDAHTITYCPVLCRSNNGIPLRSTTITLKNTRIKSNGRRRF